MDFAVCQGETRRRASDTATRKNAGRRRKTRDSRGEIAGRHTSISAVPGGLSSGCEIHRVMSGVRLHGTPTALPLSPATGS
jgi:hypothetical protein